MSFEWLQDVKMLLSLPVLGADAPSNHHSYQHRSQTHHTDRDQDLCLALQELRRDFVGYGYRRMTKALMRQGWKINHKRVERVMRQTGLTCRRKPRYVHTTDSKDGEPVYPN